MGDVPPEPGGGEAAEPGAGRGAGESTVGTGSAVAIGCTVASLLVIAIGVIVLLLARVL